MRNSNLRKKEGVTLLLSFDVGARPALGRREA